MGFNDEELAEFLKLVEAKTVRVGDPNEFDFYGKLAMKIFNYLHPHSFVNFPSQSQKKKKDE